VQNVSNLLQGKHFHIGTGKKIQWETIANLGNGERDRVDFYARKQLLLSARLSHRNSVCPSVCHMGGSVKNGASQNHQIFTVGCLEDSSFRNRRHKAFP